MGLDKIVVTGARQQDPQAPPVEGKTLYHCPMHPSYISDKPGQCPICNMDLVPMTQEETATAASEVAGHATVTISPQKLQLIGVQTGLVRKQPVKMTVRAVGVVKYNEKALSAVSLKFSGWAEELIVKSTGEKVRVGDPLLVIYSPELLEAQRNYVLALEAAAPLEKAAPPNERGQAPFSERSEKDAGSQDFSQETLRSARDRLLLWDITEDQLRQLENTKQPLTRLPIFSKTNGVVTARNVVQGGYIEAGRELYQLADLSTVWLEADIYEYEIPQVKVGDEVKVSMASRPGETLAGRITYIYPYLNDKTRTIRARFEIPNEEGKLKPGMYATVSIDVDLGEQLVVDEGAVLDSGVRQIVFVASDKGRFTPREVIVSYRTGSLAVIMKGVDEGETVVTSGNYLIDSESRLKSALTGGMAGMPGMPEMKGGAEGDSKQTGGTEAMPGHRQQ